jgi:putative DNA primase/helicase
MASLGKVFQGLPVQILDPPEVQLEQAIADAGLIPPARVVLDGNLHRFPSSDKPGDDSGWYIGFSSPIAAGRFGDWRTGIDKTWIAERQSPLSHDERLQAERRIEESRLRYEQEKKRKHEQAADNVKRIWDTATPADEAHPYLQKKRIKPNGARVTGDGRLIVPLFDHGGRLSTLQYIGPEGDKLYHPGGATKACFHTFGDISSCSTVYLAEGFATAATIYEETNTATIAAYSASNLVSVAEVLRQYQPALKIVIVADNDVSGTGKNYADQASAKFGCSVIMPPNTGDANDYRNSGGDLRALLTPQKKEWLTPIDDWCTQPAPIKWIIKGWLQAEALIMTHGPSGSGKTFVALDQMMITATGGGDWFGHKVKAGAVVYLAGEGHHGLRARVAAWCQHHGKKPKNMWVSQHAIDLNTPSGLQHALEYIRALPVKPSIIAVDTLHRFLEGDENSAQDAKTMIDACSVLQHEFKASVMLVHHTGVAEGAQKRARGSSSWRGAMENEISVTEADGVITIEATKIKDAERPAPILASLKAVEITGWFDEDGEQVRSAVVVRSDEKPEGKERKRSRKELDDMKDIEKAWFASGSELHADDPYLSRSAIVSWLIEYRGMKPTGAEQEVKPGSGKFINRLLDAGIIESRLHGYAIIDDGLVSKLALKS